MAEYKVGDYRVVPYGYRLQRLSRRGETWWSRVFGPRMSGDWETIMETASERKSQVELYLRSTGTEATWETRA